MDEALKFISETGFAIAIAVYLLIRMEKKIEGLTASIITLNESIKNVAKT